MKLTEYGRTMIPMKLTWEMTEACNLDCIHCYCRATKKPLANELSTEEGKELLMRLVKNEVLYLLLDGGEPLLRPDFFDILRLSTKHMCTWLSTNGTLIDDNAAKEISTAKVGAVFVSLQSAKKEAHEKITNTPGSYERTLHGLEKLCKHNVKTVMCSVLMKDNIDYVEDFIKLGEELTVYKVIFLRPYNIGKGKDNQKLIIPELENIRQTIEKIDALKKKSSVRISHAFGANNHNCCLQAFSVDSQGHAMNCPYLRELPRIGDIRKQSLLDIWNSAEARAIRDHSSIKGKCATCEKFEQCNGGCRSSAYFLGDGLNASDPFCWF